MRILVEDARLQQIEEGRRVQGCRVVTLGGFCLNGNYQRIGVGVVITSIDFDWIDIFDVRSGSGITEIDCFFFRVSVLVSRGKNNLYITGCTRRDRVGRGKCSVGAGRADLIGKIGLIAPYFINESSYFRQPRVIFIVSHRADNIDAEFVRFIYHRRCDIDKWPTPVVAQIEVLDSIPAVFIKCGYFYRDVLVEIGRIDLKAESPVIV